MVKAALPELSKQTLLDFYQRMFLVRRFEETAAEMYTRQKIRGFLHLYVGEEAIAVGSIASLMPDDYIISHYRDHGHALARGMEPKRVMAELFGKQTGVSHGKGGSMHLYDKSKNFLGGYAIVAGHLPIAVGLAFASSYRDEQHVCMCENNLYGMGVPIADESAITDIYRMTRAYSIPSERVDGMDVLAVYNAVRQAVEHARSGQGPYFLELLTYRFRGHSMADPELYRDKIEVAHWRERDLVPSLRKLLLEQGASEQALQEIERDVDAVIAEAVRFADESSDPTPDALYTDVYAPMQEPGKK